MDKVADRQKIETFYNEFSGQRMEQYRVSGNRRIELAVEFIRSYMQPGQVVADVGCGIGIAAGSLARAAPQSTFFGIDISEANVRSARAAVSHPNVQFLQASVTEQFDELRAWIPGPADVIYMVDVIEHIPEADRPAVLEKLVEISSPHSVLLLTYPSVEYQRHLMEQNPAELQIIDNVIETRDLIREAEAAGWMLTYFKYCDVWLSNQYVHVCFGRSAPLRAVSVRPESAIRRGVRRLWKIMASAASGTR